MNELTPYSLVLLLSMTPFVGLFIWACIGLISNKKLIACYESRIQVLEECQKIRLKSLCKCHELRIEGLETINRHLREQAIALNKEASELIEKTDKNK